MVKSTPKEMRRDHKWHNETRKSNGLDELVMKQRECLRCGRMFESESGNNRMCYTCKKTEDHNCRKGYMYSR